ncbi:hypothetical protein MJH12_09255, partial [bacterium]|nr:hypothetical protein [bacterium]
NPFYDETSKTWIYQQQDSSVFINYTATWDNTSNVAASTLSSSNIYGQMRILSQIDNGAQSELYDFGIASGQSTQLTTHVTETFQYSVDTNKAAWVQLSGFVDKIYTLEMQASIANGLLSTRAFPIRIIKDWLALSADPEITTISAGSNTISTSEKTQPQPTLAIQAPSAVITIDLKASNTNGGGLNYTVDSNTTGVAGNIVHKGNGIIEITIPSIPERNQNGSGSQVRFNYQITDTLGRNDLATIPQSIIFFIYRDHSKPVITITDSTVKVINNDYIEFNYDLVDSDGDLNTIEFTFGNFVGAVDNDLFVTPRSTEGDFNVTEGTNYYVRWYFPQDGSFFIDSRLQLKIRLTANDGSYHGVQYSNISDVPEITLSNSIDSAHHGVLSVEGQSALAGSSFIEVEPNNVYHSQRESISVKLGDKFTFKGANSHEADIRDSFSFDLEGAVTFKIASSNNASGADFGIFDRRAQKFVQFYFDHSQNYQEFLLNPMGGNRSYDFVVFGLDIDATYEFDVEFNQADFSKTFVSSEIEPNNSYIDSQFLGQLSRALNYTLSGTYDANDFYSFEVIGNYPLALDFVSSSDSEVNLILWNLDTLQKVAHFKEVGQVHTYLALERGNYAIEIQSQSQGNYQLYLKSGDELNLHDTSLAISDTDTLSDVNRHVANGISYFGGLYLGNHSPVTVGSVL